MAEVRLDSRQQELKHQIEMKLEIIQRKFEDFNDHDDIEELENKLGNLAHDLHMSLDPKPKHHRYMIENRGLEPDHPDFYKHIHPVEDLLAYLADDTANDDPEDQTIGSVFHMDVYSRRWGHSDRYTIERTVDGWYFTFMAQKGAGDKKGQPGLMRILDHDSVNYPEALPEYMEWLWDKAYEDGLSPEEVQESLDEIGEWISSCERQSPKGIFRGFK